MFVKFEKNAEKISKEEKALKAAASDAEKACFESMFANKKADEIAAKANKDAARQAAAKKNGVTSAASGKESGKKSAEASKCPPEAGSKKPQPSKPKVPKKETESQKPGKEGGKKSADMRDPFGTSESRTAGSGNVMNERMTEANSYEDNPYDSVYTQLYGEDGRREQPRIGPTLAETAMSGMKKALVDLEAAGAANSAVNAAETYAKLVKKGEDAAKNLV